MRFSIIWQAYKANPNDREIQIWCDSMSFLMQFSLPNIGIIFNKKKIKMFDK